ncbi:PSME3-interacting protein isoform X2 [Lycorma delicatula]|uniref:PSME3-interacting protein isoform X2 n=1 Tax=Lycorma delicatula TaxID=130591 RepID=UPI003F512D87
MKYMVYFQTIKFKMSSGFISENELAEKRRCRQEEWEKVRRPDQPLEAPEEEYDHRSLFERLQEQKQKREFEYEEAHRLKHMIKGLDDDEVEFLDLVDRSKLEEERKKSAEEAREMADFRNAVASLQEQSLEQRIQQEIKSKVATVPITNSYTSQTKLLAGAVVKKRVVDTPVESVKRRRTESEDSANTSSETVPVSAPATGLRCIGVLPGISYSESSDSESSDTDIEVNTPIDLLGRKVETKQKVTASQ